MTDTTTTAHDPVTGEVLEDASSIDAAEAAAALARDDKGQQVESIITPKMFLPPGADGDPKIDPRILISLEPQGSVIILGSIAGTIFKVEHHENEYPKGSGVMLKSVWLIGDFEAKNYATGAILQAGQCALPNSYGRMIAASYDMALARGADPRDLAADLDCEIGVKSMVRGAVKFQWFCQNYVESPTARRVRELRNKQEARLARRRMTAISDQSQQVQTAAPATPQIGRASRR